MAEARSPRALALLLAILLGCLTGCQHESKLPKLFPVPDTTLTDEHGKPFSTQSLKGSVVVYDFIFTNCAGTCPLMSATMRRLVKSVDPKANVRFVSISVDPVRDTPAVLANYASKVRNDDRWIFLTGGRDTVVRLSVDGFKLAAGGEPQPGGEALMHSSKFAVADRNGVIREYYGASESDSVEHVAGSVNDLLRE